MQNTSSPTSLALSGDSISYSPTLSPLLTGGRDMGWKMRSHSSLGHNTLLKGKFCCARYLTQTNWSPVPRRHRVTSWKLKQNLSAQLREERSTYELQVKLFAAQCQPKYAAAQARRGNSNGFSEAEQAATHLPQSFPSFPLIYVSQTIFSWQVLFRLPQLNSYLTGWFPTVRCFSSDQMWEAL